MTDGLCSLLLPSTCTIIEMLHGVRFNVYLSTSIFFTHCLLCCLENAKHFANNTIYFPERLDNQVKPLKWSLEPQLHFIYKQITFSFWVTCFLHVTYRTGKKSLLSNCGSCSGSVTRAWIKKPGSVSSPTLKESHQVSVNLNI